MHMGLRACMVRIIILISFRPPSLPRSHVCVCMYVTVCVCGLNKYSALPDFAPYMHIHTYKYTKD